MPSSVAASYFLTLVSASRFSFSFVEWKAAVMSFQHACRPAHLHNSEFSSCEELLREFGSSQFDECILYPPEQKLI